MLPGKYLKIKTNWLLPVTFTLLCFVLPLIAFADEEGPIDPNDVPIDGGLGILLAAGIGYGVKKYRDAAKERKPNI